jgi:orotate phosphoribosyltransferase
MTHEFLAVNNAIQSIMFCLLAHKQQQFQTFSSVKGLALGGPPAGYGLADGCKTVGFMLAVHLNI